MTKRHEARYRRAVERNLRNAELYERRRRSGESPYFGEALRGMTIAEAAYRLGIRERDADYGNGPLAHLEIRNRLINLIK